MCELIVSRMTEEEFAEREDITKVVITEGNAAIPAGAFMHCRNLREIFLPQSLHYIGDGAFFGCSSLCHIDLPDGLQEIGEYAFSESGMVEITVPASVRRIKEMAFYDCQNLKLLDILAEDCVIGKDAYCHTPTLRHGFIACGYPEEETKASMMISTLLVLDTFDRHSERIQNKAMRLFKEEPNLYMQEIINKNMVSVLKVLAGRNCLEQEMIEHYLQISLQQKKHEISLLLLQTSRNVTEEEFDL